LKGSGEVNCGGYITRDFRLVGGMDGERLDLHDVSG
jgi:hypothetical protein